MAVFAAGFPPSPKPGEIHTGDNGVQYKWNGSAWDIVSTGGGGGGDGGSGGGGDGSCPDTCIEYTNEQVNAEALERQAGDSELEDEVQAIRTESREHDEEIHTQLSEHDARLKVLESIEIDGDGNEIDLSDYATKAALESEEKARADGDEILQAEVENNKDAIEALDKSVDQRLEKYVDEEWVYENTADPDQVAPINHNHDATYAKKDHSHDDIEVDLSDYAKGQGITFTKRAGNLYVSWS